MHDFKDLKEIKSPRNCGVIVVHTDGSLVGVNLLFAYFQLMCRMLGVEKALDVYCGGSEGMFTIDDKVNGILDKSIIKYADVVTRSNPEEAGQMAMISTSVELITLSNPCMNRTSIGNLTYLFKYVVDSKARKHLTLLMNKLEVEATQYNLNKITQCDFTLPVK